MQTSHGSSKPGQESYTRKDSFTGLETSHYVEQSEPVASGDVALEQNPVLPHWIALPGRAASWLMYNRRVNFKNRPYLWIVLAMLAVGGILQYGDVLTRLSHSLPFGLTTTSMEEILYLLPIVYGGFIFGFRGGLVTAIVAAALMLPHAVFLAPNRANALFESIAIILVSGMILLMFEGQQRERQHRQEIVATLEVARQELSSHIDLIKKNERELSAINEVCKMVNQSLELPQTLNLILNKVMEVASVEVALLFLIDSQTHELRLAASHGISEEFAKAMFTLKIGEGFNGKVAESGQPMVVEDASADPRLTLPQVKREGIRSQLIVPLKSKESVIGTLCIATRSLRKFPPEEMQMLTAIGSQVGIAIENARLYKEVRISEEQYRDLFENASMAMFVHDLQGNIVAANKACVALTGYDREELIGMSTAQLRPPGSGTALQEVEDQLLKGQAIKQAYEMNLIKKDGTEAIVSLSTRTILKDGQPEGAFLGVNRPPFRSKPAGLSE